MSKTIKELEKERDEILAKALRLAEIAKRNADEAEEWVDAIAAIEAHRPKLERLRYWVNLAKNGARYHCEDAFTAKQIAMEEAHAYERVAVPMIEALPAPKWERWEAVFDGDFWELRGSDGVMSTFINGAIAQKIAAVHNAEMERMAALWEGGEDE